MAVTHAPAVAGFAESRWRRWIARLGVDLRPGEGLPALLLFLGFFLLIAFQYATKSVRQSTYIQSLGAAKLPLAYLLVALSSYPLLRLYSRLADRLSRLRLIAATSTLIAMSMVLFWWLFQFSWGWVPVVFYIWVSIAYVMIVSQFWAFSTLVFDPRQAKRLFGFVGAGGLLGGIAGGQVARFATHLVGTRYALLVGAGMLLLFVAMLLLVARLATSDREAVQGGASGLAKLSKAKGGWEALRTSRHLRLIAGLMLLTIMVAQVVDLQFNWAVEQSTQSLDEATSFFGNFYSVMGIAAFVFQFLFTARIHRLLGVGFAMRVLPVTMALGTGSLFVAAMFPGASLVAAALVLKIGENGLRYSLDQATRELLYIPVPADLRVKAKAFIDVFVQRGAKGLAAVLLLLVTFDVLTVLQAGWISLSLIVLWLGVTVALEREYVTSFLRGLKRRSVDTSVPINLSDVTTLELLVQSLGSSDKRQVLHALELLDTYGRGHLVPPLLLYHDDADVRHRTLEVLARVGRRDAVHLVERRLGDEDPDVRARAVRTLAELRGEEATGLMGARLRDPDAGVRAAAIACLAIHGGEEAIAAARENLGEMLSDGDSRVRTEAAKALGTIQEPLFQAELVRLLYDANSEVVRAAVAAVRRRAARDGFQPLYLPSLVSLLQRRRLKHDAREALVALGEPAVPALVHFMKDPEEPVWVRRAIPKALAAIGTTGASEALVETLAVAEDGFLRRKLVESLTGLPEAVRGGIRPALEQQIHREAERYFSALRSLTVLHPGGELRLDGPLVSWREEDDPDLLSRLLGERMEESVHLLFRLLSILQPAEHVRAAHGTLVGGPATLRGHALELLDNVLEGTVQRDVFLVVGDAPVGTRIRGAERLFGAGPTNRVDAISAHLRKGFDGDSVGFCVAALYAVHRDAVATLYPRAEELAEEGNGDPFVRETASWVLARRRAPGRRFPASEEGERTE